LFWAGVTEIGYSKEFGVGWKIRAAAEKYICVEKSLDTNEDAVIQ
jgi:hypothetical protein